MPVKLRCGCGKLLSARDESRGRAVKCPGCGARVTVPTARAQVAPAALGQERECVTCGKPLSVQTRGDACAICTSRRRARSSGGAFAAWSLVRGADFAKVLGIALLGAFAAFGVFHLALFPLLGAAGLVLLVAQAVVGAFANRMAGPNRAGWVLCLVLGGLGAGGVYVILPAIARARGVAEQHLAPSESEAGEAIRTYSMTRVVRATDAFGRAIGLREYPRGIVERVEVAVERVEPLPQQPDGTWISLVRADVTWYISRGGNYTPEMHRVEGLVYQVQKHVGGRVEAFSVLSDGGPPQEVAQLAGAPTGLIVEGIIAPGVEILVVPQVALGPPLGEDDIDGLLVLNERLARIWSGAGTVAGVSAGSGLALPPASYTVLVRRRVPLDDGHFYRQIRRADGRTAEEHIEEIEMFWMTEELSFYGGMPEGGPPRCDQCTRGFPGSIDTTLGGAQYLIGSLTTSELVLGCIFPEVTKEEGRSAVLTVSNRTLMRGLER